MLNRSFFGGLALGVIAGGALTVWAWERTASKPLLMGSSSFVSSPDFVFIQGTLAGRPKDPADSPINNTMAIDCQRASMQCRVSTVNQIGPDQTSPIDEDTIRITEWTDSEVSATSLQPGNSKLACNYYEIRIFLKAKETTYTRVPNPDRNKDRCKELFGSGGAVKVWQIADPFKLRYPDNDTKS